MPNQAWFSSVTDSNSGKADIVATSWQQVLTRSVRKEEKTRQRFLLTKQNSIQQAKGLH